MEASSPRAPTTRKVTERKIHENNHPTTAEKGNTEARGFRGQSVSCGELAADASFSPYSCTAPVESLIDLQTFAAVWRASEERKKRELPCLLAAPCSSWYSVQTELK